MTIRPIETEYSGHLFRSRLEARWAVFFDALKLGWQYEPQGYDLDGIRYLPDFRVQQPAEGMNGLFVEVKGEIDEDTVVKASNLAYHLCSAVLLVGDIPRDGERGPHFYVFDRFMAGDGVLVHAASVYGVAPTWLRTEPFGWPLGRLSVGLAAGDPTLWSIQVRHALDNIRSPRWNPSAGRVDRPGVVAVESRVAAAFNAARQARFEHGVSGAPQRAFS